MKDNKDDKLDNKKRKIEFRVKDKTKNKWYYGCPIMYDDGSFSFYDTELVEKCDHCLDAYPYPEVDENTLGQFTGLCDKDGKEIYEGDIIKSHYGSIYIVKYFADWSGFSLKLVFLNIEGKLSRATGRQHLYKNDCTRLEVLGNVWDRPELLGGSDEECDN